MTMRWCVLSAMNRRLPALSATTLPGKYSGLLDAFSACSLVKCIGLSLSVRLARWRRMSLSMTGMASR